MQSGVKVSALMNNNFLFLGKLLVNLQKRLWLIQCRVITSWN